MRSVTWVHNLNPYMIEFADSFGIRWYGLAYLAGFIAAALLLLPLARRKIPGILSLESLPGFMTACVFGLMIGGRLGYVLLYNPNLAFEFSAQAPYWEVFRVWRGGMASHGGICGLVIAIALYAWRQKIEWPKSLFLLDLAALCSPLGIFFGRIANFINGELFGREASQDFVFAVKFPREVFLWLNHDLQPTSTWPELSKATPAIQALGSPTVAEWNTWLSQIHLAEFQEKVKATLEGLVSAIQHGNNSATIALAPYLLPRYPSQILEAILEGLVLFLFISRIARRPLKPGVLASVWLIGYSIMRFLAEFTRLPDPQIGFEAMHLTRGQWISIGTFICGTVLFWACLGRQTNERLNSQNLDAKAL
jgi:phosphatidylglycerol---prolipoprotein diacylglyceryl transferase